ncbi:MAG: ATP-binding protein, partial [Acidimicrobiia bacterium]
DDIGAVMRSVAETVARVLRTCGAVVLERDPSGEFVLVGQSSEIDLDPSAVAAVADRAHMTAAPVVLRTATEIEFAAPGLRRDGVSSVVAVMIPGSDIEFGTLAVVARDERVFTSDDLNFLHSVANVLAAAVDKAAAQDRLEDLLRSKDSFVASVSHELRTPLTVVTGMAHELNERWMDLSDDELGEFTQLLVEQSRDMSDLIEDLLVAARANIGEVAVRIESVRLDEEINSVLAGFTSAPGTRIATELANGVVEADSMRVRQIIRNLITNAQRYGGPNVAVRMREAPGAWVVDVCDDGSGIPPSDQERIFTAYERAHHAAGQPGSVGLGLTVSRTLAVTMGGSLTYHFVDGSIFRLELPSEASDKRPSSRVTPAPSVAIGRGRIGVDVGVVD